MQTAHVITLPPEPAGAGSPVAILRTQKALLHDPATNAAMAAVFMAIASFADPSGVCWPSQETLAELLGKSRAWVSDHVKALEQLGYLEVQHRYLPQGGQTSNIYRLRLPPQVLRASAPPCQPADTPLSETDFGCQPAGTPRQPAGTNLLHSNLPEPVDAPAREAAPAPRPVSKTNEEGEQKPDGEVVPLPVGAVARRIQRCSRRPWKLDTALQVIQTTITRTGLEAVQQLASALEAEPGGLDPWVITGRLRTLGRPQPPTSANANADAGGDRREPPAQVAPASPLPPGLTDDAVRWLRRRVEPQHLRHLTGADRVVIEGDTATIIVATPFAAHMIHSQLDHLLSGALGVRSVRVLSRAEATP